MEQLLSDGKLCRECGAVLSKRLRVFCGVQCKSMFQRRARPVSREWLWQKYIVEKLDCNQIGALVKRDGKSVWNWLKDFGIPTRGRGFASSATWMRIGGVSLFAGRKHSEQTRRRLSLIAKQDGRVPFDRTVGPPLKGKRGVEVPTWKGGVTPQRQAFYSTAGWKAAVAATWRRDNATCQRCGRKKSDDRSVEFDVHHIVGFHCVELRAAVSNLVLLCEPCHYWVHSSDNLDRLFIKEFHSESVA